MNKHTQTPWTLSHIQGEIIVDNLRLLHVYCPTGSGDIQQANAAFIVKAVNNHAALVEALEGFMSAMEKYGEWDEGCFYYERTAAPELELPMKDALKALSQAPQP